MKNIYLGIDVGSVSCNVVAIGEKDSAGRSPVLAKTYIRTFGDPIGAVKKGLIEVEKILAGEAGESGDESIVGADEGAGKNCAVAGVGTTGSGRVLAAVLAGADVIKNEITAHAVAAADQAPGVKTVLEIGGQDSKIIILDGQGSVLDFAMNTVCAAGTGSFLDQQCGRLGLKIEEFGDLALQAENHINIAGRCTVFAESDMIHKQQIGAKREDIIRGLCAALVRNYLNNVAKGKQILGPIVFQGGVAANKGIVAEFEKALGQKIIVPENFDVMGAIGAALLARDFVVAAAGAAVETGGMAKTGKAAGAPTKFKGFSAAARDFQTSAFECFDCPNKCEVVEFKENGAVIACWGDRCNKWSEKLIT